MPDTLVETSAPDVAPASTTSLIHARGLTKMFGDLIAVDAIDFDVAPGESFTLTGLFSVDRNGEFQLQLRHAMQIAVLVDDVPVYEAERRCTAKLRAVAAGTLAPTRRKANVWLEERK